MYIAFQVCQAPLIACIGGGRIVWQLGMDSLEGTRRIHSSFLRLWMIRRHGFGILFFWMLGSCNDINILQRLPLFSKLANGESTPMEFKASSHTYNMGYYLVDGIFPKLATFVKPLRAPEGKKLLQFHNTQAMARNDMEREHSGFARPVFLL
jgi:hypothetical protein